jgi:4-hydroxybenzoate polyprenyltransferase
MKYLKLIRYQNLLLLAFMQLIFRYGFLKLQHIPLALNDWQYGLLILSTVMLAAGGYVINNICDQESDTENKPQNVIVGNTISETAAYNIYVALNIIGVGIGFYLSNVILRPSFASLFILIAATLYFYATSLKQMMIIGNIIVALLLASSVLIIGIFDIFPATYEANQQQMATMFSILLDYAVFAFIINFIREIVKDSEDVNGDYNMGMNTLPIAVGIARTSKIVFGLSLITVVFILQYVNNYIMKFDLYYAAIYILIFIIGPLILFTVKVWAAKSKKDFHVLSTLLKWVIFFGMLSLLVITLNVKGNA